MKKSVYLFKSLLLLLLFFGSTQLYANVYEYYVKPAATGTGLGDSFANAFGSLQEALTVASSTGGKIYVAKGTYLPTNQFDFDASGGTNPREVTFQIPNGVEVYGGFAGTETTIDQAVLDARNFTANTTILSGDIGTVGDNADNAYHVVYTKNVSSNAKVNGFTITGGNANGSSVNNRGAGWYNNGSRVGNISNPSLTNITFSQNTATDAGGGMYNDGFRSGRSNPSLVNCSFSQNTASVGGGMYNDGNEGTSNPSLVNCSFFQNTAGSGGGIYNYGYNFGTSSPSLVNCSFSQNTANNFGGGMSNDGSSEGNSNPSLVNCSFFQNMAVNGGGMYNNGGSGGMTNPQITNSIFWGNTATAGGKSWFNNTANPNVSYSLVEEATLPISTTTTGGNNILGQDPLFVDAANGNLNLRTCSPAIDNGNNTINSSVTDLAGNPRKFNTTIDRGAYEYQGVPTPTKSFFVKIGGSDTNTGANFVNAFATLQKALSNSCSGDKIYVAKGTYLPTNQFDFDGLGADPREVNFQIPNNVEVYGGFAGTETTIDQAVLDGRNFSTNTTILSGDIGTVGNITDNAYHVIYTKNVSSNTKVNGFTITGGNADGVGSPNDFGAGWYNDGNGVGNTSNPSLTNIIFSQNTTAYDGGGMYNNGEGSGNSSPSLVNCSFFQNTAGSAGGGVYNYGYDGNSSPSLVNCSFSQNTANGNGGGMFNFGAAGTSSPSLVNCSFSQNTANGDGGGMFNFGAFTGNSSPSLVNCSFSQNSADDGGGGMYNFGNSGISSPQITNSIFWGNTASGNPNSWFNNNATPNVSYSLVEEATLPISTTTTGGNNILGQDPLFVDAANGDLSLQTGSPAIDTGNNAVASSGTDLAGNPRIFNTTVDMGAYEFTIVTILAEAYVRATGGNDSNTGVDFANAFATLQKALSVVGTGSKISAIPNVKKILFIFEFL
jgi:hypothetical protein